MNADRSSPAIGGNGRLRTAAARSRNRWIIASTSSCSAIVQFAPAGSSVVDFDAPAVFGAVAFVAVALADATLLALTVAGASFASSGVASMSFGARAGRVLRQNQYVSRPINNATTRSPVITSATTVPVLSLFLTSLPTPAGESLAPGTSSGPPLGAVWPGGTGVEMV